MAIATGAEDCQQVLVGLMQLNESIVRASVSRIRIGMVLSRQTPIRRFDLIQRSARPQSQDLIAVSNLHLSLQPSYMAEFLEPIFAIIFFRIATLWVWKVSQFNAIRIKLRNQIIHRLNGSQSILRNAIMNRWQIPP